MTLTSLINKCIQKDSAAEKLLYLRYVDSLMSVAYRYCRDINSAKDVVQNAFVKIYDNLHTFDTQKGNINQWTHRIVVNESLQYIRKQKTWLVGESFIDIESSIEATQFDTITISEVKDIINNLPDIHRIILNLYYFESYTHKEIAVMLNIKTSHSRTRLSRSRKILKEKWESHNLIAIK